jgi:hypothetical protein
MLNSRWNARSSGGGGGGGRGGGGEEERGWGGGGAQEEEDWHNAEKEAKNEAYWKVIRGQIHWVVTELSQKKLPQMHHSVRTPPHIEGHKLVPNARTLMAAYMMTRRACSMLHSTMSQPSSNVDNK